MEIRFKTQDFSDGLGRIGSVIQSKPIMPSSGGVLFSFGDNTVTIHATDIENYLKTSFPCMCSTEMPPLLIDYQFIKKVLSSAKSDELRVNVNEGGCTFISGKSKFSTGLLNAADFISPPDVGENILHFGNCDDLIDALSQNAELALKTSLVPTPMENVHVVMDNGIVFIESGHLSSVASQSIPGLTNLSDIKDYKFVIRTTTVRAIARVKKSVEIFGVTKTHCWVKFSDGTVSYSVLPDMSFPDLKPVLPEMEIGDGKTSFIRIDPERMKTAADVAKSCNEDLDNNSIIVATIADKGVVGVIGFSENSNDVIESTDIEGAGLMHPKDMIAIDGERLIKMMDYFAGFETVDILWDGGRAILITSQEDFSRYGLIAQLATNKDQKLKYGRPEADQVPASGAMQ